MPTCYPRPPRPPKNGEVVVIVVVVGDGRKKVLIGPARSLESSTGSPTCTTISKCLKLSWVHVRPDQGLGKVGKVAARTALGRAGYDGKAMLPDADTCEQRPRGYIVGGGVASHQACL